MKIKAAPKLTPQTIYAAQNAREGLIGVADLSLLTGVDANQLNKFAKTGTMAHYGEYHGKRFFNFQEIINWLHGGDQNDAKPVIREKMEAMIESGKCPYTLKKSSADQNVQIIWRDIAEAA